MRHSMKAAGLIAVVATFAASAGSAEISLNEHIAIAGEGSLHSECSNLLQRRAAWDYEQTGPGVIVDSRWDDSEYQRAIARIDVALSRNDGVLKWNQQSVEDMRRVLAEQETRLAALEEGKLHFSDSGEDALSKLMVRQYETSVRAERYEASILTERYEASIKEYEAESAEYEAESANLKARRADLIARNMSNPNRESILVTFANYKLQNSGGAFARVEYTCRFTLETKEVEFVESSRPELLLAD